MLTRPLELVREEQDESNRLDYLEEYYSYEDVLDSDTDIMEASSILHRPRPKKVVQVPVLPQRSAKRASTILANVMQELKSLDEKASKEEDGKEDVQESDPHEQYLSSEEDASLSDDYEGSLMDFEQPEGDETRGRQSSRSSRRKSQEDTARVVSFMMVGKPQIVDIIPISPTTSIPTSRQSMNLDVLTTIETKIAEPTLPKPTARRPPPLTLYPDSRPDSRRVSVASTTSYIPPSANSVANSLEAPPMRHPNASTSNLSAHTHDPTSRHLSRKSSRLGFSNLTSLVTGTSNSTRKTSSSTPQAQAANPTPVTASSSHSFLNSDPFAHNIHSEDATHNLPPSPTATPTTPKTPNSLALWKKGLVRSLSKSRKPSKPKLYNSNAASSSTLSLTSTSTTHATQVRSSTSHGPHSAGALPTLSSFASLSSRGKRNSTATILSSTTVSSFSSQGAMQSTTSLARISTNLEPATPDVESINTASNPVSTSLSNSNINTNTNLPPRTQMAVKRSETMPLFPSPSPSSRHNEPPLRSPRDSAPPHLGGRYEEVMRRMDVRQQGEVGKRESVDVSVDTAGAKSVKEWRKERRSLAAVALSLTKKKSVKR